MATKQTQKLELAMNQSTVHRDWLRLNVYLMETTDDPIIKDRCRNLSADFRRCGALDAKINPSTQTLPLTEEIKELEAKLLDGGWK